MSSLPATVDFEHSLSTDVKLNPLPGHVYLLLMLWDLQTMRKETALV